MEEEDDEEVPAEMKWGFAVLMLVLTCLCGQAFLWHCRRMAEALSEPQIMTRIRDPDSQEIVIVDDYREAYGFLREKTPEDSRVLAWCVGCQCWTRPPPLPPLPPLPPPLLPVPTDGGVNCSVCCCARFCA